MRAQRYKQLSRAIFSEIIPSPAQGLSVGQANELVNAYAEAMQCIHRRADEREAHLKQCLLESGVSPEEPGAQQSARSTGRAEGARTVHPPGVQQDPRGVG